MPEMTDSSEWGIQRQGEYAQFNTPRNLLGSQSIPSGWTRYWYFIVPNDLRIWNIATLDFACMGPSYHWIEIRINGVAVYYHNGYFAHRWAPSTEHPVGLIADDVLQVIITNYNTVDWAFLWCAGFYRTKLHSNV
jgi:hypothetical protein